MRQIILVAVAAVAAAVFMLPACGGEAHWTPVQGDAVHRGDAVTAASPLPAGVDCLNIEHGPVTQDDRVIYSVIELPTETTATISPGTGSWPHPADYRIVDVRCLAPYRLK